MDIPILQVFAATEICIIKSKSSKSFIYTLKYWQGITVIAFTFVKNFPLNVATNCSDF
jgi:hypothetical protein